VGDYSGLSFREEAEEPTVVLGGSSELRLTLAAGGGNATLSSVPEFLAPEWQSGRSFRGFNGDYREFNESFRQPAYPYGGLVSYEIKGPHDYFLTIDSGGQFSGLLLEPWAEDLADNFPSRVVHPFATELPADQDERYNAIRELADRPGGPKPTRLLADPGPGVEADEFMESARRLAIDLGGNAEVDLAVVRYDWAGRPLNLAHHIFRVDSNDPQNDEETASGDYRNKLRLTAMLADAERRRETQKQGPSTEEIDGEVEEARSELANIAQRDSHRRSVERARERGEEATALAENTSSLAWSAGAQAGEDPLDRAWRVLRSALILPASNTDLARAQRVDAFNETTNVFIGGGRDLDSFLVRDRRMTTDELAREIVRQLVAQGILRPYVVLYVRRGEQLGSAVNSFLAERNEDVTVICTPGFLNDTSTGELRTTDRWIAYQESGTALVGRPGEELGSFLNRVRGRRSSRRPLAGPPRPLVTDDREEPQEARRREEQPETQHGE
jgi:hypothetical protein